MFGHSNHRWSEFLLGLHACGNCYHQEATTGKVNLRTNLEPQNASGPSPRQVSFQKQHWRVGVVLLYIWGGRILPLALILHLLPRLPTGWCQKWHFPEHRLHSFSFWSLWNSPPLGGDSPRLTSVIQNSEGWRTENVKQWALTAGRQGQISKVQRALRLGTKKKLISFTDWLKLIRSQHWSPHPHCL